jgi:hypothetical protein
MKKNKTLEVIAKISAGWYLGSLAGTIIAKKCPRFARNFERKFCDFTEHIIESCTTPFIGDRFSERPDHTRREVEKES